MLDETGRGLKVRRVLKGVLGENEIVVAVEVEQNGFWRKVAVMKVLPRERLLI